MARPSNEPQPSLLDYFWIEAAEDDSTLSFDNWNASYNLSSSFDRISWTALTSNVIATGVNTGTKVYLAGNTTTLGATNSYPPSVCRPTSDKKYKLGGKIFSLYSYSLEPKELTNSYDLQLFQSNKTGLIEWNVDLRPITNAKRLLENCYYISGISDESNWSSVVNADSMLYDFRMLNELPSNFSLPNATSVCRLFCGCNSLSFIPDGFICPNAVNVESMFEGCFVLKSLPDGLTVPNATNTNRMFYECQMLSSIPDGWTFPNATTTQAMFAWDYALTKLPDGFDTSASTDANNMFSNCRMLSALPDGFSLPNTRRSDRYVH